VHEASRHDVESFGYVQVSVCTPSQVPPQTVPSETQADLPPRGAPTTGLHVPSLPATSQAWHWSVHAESQHSPSTQWPSEHWSSALHVAACAFFGTQVLLASQ
jgi:hypothetical protein